MKPTIRHPMMLPPQVTIEHSQEQRKHRREKRTRQHLPERVTTRELLFLILEQLWEMEYDMEQELQRLADDIAGLTSVVGGSITLLDKLAAMIAAIPTSDPATQAKISELANAVEATKQQLADAIVRDTPADTTAPADTTVADTPVDTPPDDTGV